MPNHKLQYHQHQDEFLNNKKDYHEQKTYIYNDVRVGFARPYILWRRF